MKFQLKARLQQEKLKIHEENQRLQQQLKQALKLREKLKQAVHTRMPIAQPTLIPPPPPPGTVFLQKKLSPEGLKAPPYSAQVSPKIVQQQEAEQQQLLQQQRVVQQQRIQAQHIQQQQVQEHQIQQQPVQQQQVQQQQVQQKQVQKQRQQNQNDQQQANKKPEIKKEESDFEKALRQAASITYDPFYSPILEKIDQILNNLGFSDEPCRERLICSMYKDPVKFSPHSNLLSSELSRLVQVSFN